MFLLRLAETTPEKRAGAFRVDRRAAQLEPAMETALELLLATGERLRIGAGVDAATLRTVLEALRA